MGTEIAQTVRTLRTELGTVQLIARRTQRRHLSLDGEQTLPLTSTDQSCFLVRRIGAQSTEFHLFDELNTDVFIETLRTADNIPEEPATGMRSAAQARTSGLDLKLHRHLRDPNAFVDLADSIRLNVLHEAERVPGLNTLSGSLSLWNRHTFVSSADNVIGATQGALEASIKFNEAFGEQLTQVHAPESFLPIALFGARSWQRYGALPIVRHDGLTDREIILHPRALESALRSIGFAQLRQSLRADACDINCEGLFLVDDPTIEGLWTARDFDDLGNATFRQPLIVRGQSSRRSIRPEAFGQSWFPDDLSMDGDLRPLVGFSGLLVGRGESTLQEILANRPSSVLVNKWSVKPSEEEDLGFVAEVQQGIVMDGDTAAGLVAPGRLRIRGTLFDGENSLFSGATLSRELQDTGSAVTPFVWTGLRT